LGSWLESYPYYESYEKSPMMELKLPAAGEATKEGT
jgi:hypothetical protein